MKKLFLLLTFTLLLSASYAQDYQKIDSLKQILKTLPELDGTDADTTKIKIYINIADIEFYNNLDSALNIYLRIVDTCFNTNKIKNHKIWAQYNAEILYKIGKIFYYNYNNSLAKQYCLLSLKYGEEINYDHISARNLNILGLIENNLGNIDNAYNYYEKSLQISKKINNKKFLFASLSNLGHLLSDLGNYFEAESFITQALKIAEELNDKSMIATSFNNLGIITRRQGNLIQAIQYFTNSLKISKNLIDSSDCLGNLGNVAGDMGNYPLAVNYLEQSLKICKMTNRKPGIAACLGNLGNIAEYQANYTNAEQYYKKSIIIFTELGNQYEISNCLLNLANIEIYKKNYSEAISYTKQALKIKNEEGDKPGISLSLSNLGLIASYQGDYIQATNYYNKALQIAEEIKAKSQISSCFMNKGDIALVTDNFNEAIAYYERAQKIDEELGKKATLAEYSPILAKAYIKTNRIVEALPLFLKSKNITLWLLKDNFAIMSENDKDKYLTKTKSIFNYLHEFHLKYPEVNDSLSDICYNNELLLKGLLLNSSAGLMNEIYNSTNVDVKNAFFLLKQYRDQISGLQGTETPGRDFIIADLEQKANEQERELARLSKDFSNTQNILTNNWQEVQQNLQNNQAAIELVQISHTFDKHDTCKIDSFSYAALILKPGMPHPEMVPLCDEISLNKLVGSIGWSDPALVRTIYKPGSSKGQRLYEKIWQPLEPYLKDIKTITIAPTGVLHQIAFHAIPCPDSTLLCDRFNINVVSSTRILADSADREQLFTTKNNNVAIFGGIQYEEDTTLIASLSQYHKTNSQQLAMRFKESYATRGSVMPWQYLDGSMQEAKTINQHLQQKKIKSVLYSGSNALEEYFKQLEQQPSPDIIHIATHGFSFPLPDKQNAYKIFENSFVQNFNPLFRSGLLFAGANRTWANASRIDSIEDGVLTAYEVSNMNLQNTQLVVLSACETGLGDIKGSEGVYGLQRAFKMAGVKYIIMSLWPVPDKETQELMVTFYDKLIETKNIRKAFEAAQSEMKKKYEPYYWAGFVLIE